MEPGAESSAASPERGWSHALHWDDNSNVQPVIFFHNSDYTGDVSIGRPEHEGQPSSRVEIPFAALRYFFAEYLRDRAIAEIEHATEDALERRGTG